MYCVENFKSGKALKEAVKSGREVRVFQPGPFGPAVPDGWGVAEGPHNPEPHKWWVGVVVKDGVVVKIQERR